MSFRAETFEKHSNHLLSVVSSTLLDHRGLTIDTKRNLISALSETLTDLQNFVNAGHLRSDQYTHSPDMNCDKKDQDQSQPKEKTGLSNGGYVTDEDHVCSLVEKASTKSIETVLHYAYRAANLKVFKGKLPQIREVNISSLIRSDRYISRFIGRKNHVDIELKSSKPIEMIRNFSSVVIKVYEAFQKKEISGELEVALEDELSIERLSSLLSLMNLDTA
jgi:hypothetical protein